MRGMKERKMMIQRGDDIPDLQMCDVEKYQRREREKWRQYDKRKMDNGRWRVSLPHERTEKEKKEKRGKSLEMRKTQGKDSSTLLFTFWAKQPERDKFFINYQIFHPREPKYG